MSKPTPAGKNDKKNNGTPDDDILNGNADSGTVDGKAGNDTVAGGDGDDWVKGGSGSDRLIYRVADNAGTVDRYDGGSGTDTLVLEMSRTDWMRDEVQADIASFLVFLQSGNGNLNGKGFVFTSLNLEVRKIERLEVLVDGVALDPRDEAVIANDDSATSSTEHSLITGDVTANDLIPDVVRAVELIDPVTQGELTLQVNGQYQYDPGMVFDYLAKGETAPVSFGYRVSDADRDSDTARVNLTITGTNDTPVANADNGSTDENVALIVEVLANDTDVDASDTHTVDEATIRSGLGSVGIVANKVQWTPGTDYDYLALGEEATVTIDYTQSDNNDASADSELTITVVGSNDAPVANADSGSTDENAALIVDVLANDTDLDASDTHTVDVATIRNGLGSVGIVANKVQWTPGTDYDYLALGEEATVAIDYTQSDNNDASADSELTIKVIGSNDAPIANADSGSTDENAAITVDVLANDTDLDLSDTHAVDVATIRNGFGSVSVVSNKVQWTPGTDYDYLALGEEVRVVIDYTQSDNNDASADSELTITVVGSNDAPVANADSGSTDENAAITVDVLANDTDLDLSDTHTVDDATIRSGLGSVGIVANKVQWTPGTDYDYLALGEEATVVIDYTESDNNDASADSELTITVVGSNDAPVANADAGSTDENAAITVDVLANDTDVDASDTHTVDTALIAEGSGSVDIIDNKIVWQPGTDYDYLAVGETATVVIDYTNVDNNDASSAASLTISVVGSNDNPIAIADQAITDENTALTVDVLANDTDLDETDTHTVDHAIITSGLGAVAVVNNKIEWTPGEDYDYLAQGETATISIDYAQSDNNGGKDESSLLIEVVGVNDKPVVADTLGSEANEQDAVYTIDLLAGASDVDQGAVLSVANLTELTGKGGWTLANNQLTVNPDHFDNLNNGDISALTFSYQVVDEHGAVAEQALNLNINGFTDAPFLEITASAGEIVNAINLTITSQPAGDERVALSFRNLGPDVRIYDAASNDVTAGVANFSGTEVFKLVMPPMQDTIGDVTIAASGMDDDGSVLGESAGVVPLSFDYSNTKQNVIFSSQDQGIWASGDAPAVHFHQYLPVVGGVSQIWNPVTKVWEGTGTGKWSSGSFPALSSELNIDDNVRALVKAAPQAALDTAKTNFEDLLATADDVLNAAKSAHTATIEGAADALEWAKQVAQNAYDAAMDTATVVTYAGANAAYNAAVAVAQAAYNAHVAAWGWLPFGVAQRDAQAVYDWAVGLAAEAKALAYQVVDGTVDALSTTAQEVLDAANAAATAVYNAAKAAADSVLEAAEDTYNEARTGVVAVAESAFNEAQKLLDDTVALVNEMEGKTVLNVDAEVFAEVGIKIDFVLDSGSVDTMVAYVLDSAVQQNRSTDVLVITPSFTNKTTGQTVAFATVSPNASFKVALLYEVGAAFDIFLDSYLISSGETIYDISGDAPGYNINSTISTGGLQTALDGAQEVGASTQGIMVGEITLIDFDSTKLEQVEVPLLESVTDGSVRVELGIPSVKVDGREGTYNDNYFKEGSFINVHPSEIIGSLLNLVTAKLDLSPEMRAKYGLESISAQDFQEAIAEVGEALQATMFDILNDRKIDKVPFFVLDARDETSNQLLHGNFISDDKIGGTVTDDLGSFGFYAGYAESNDVFKITMDVDQAYSWIINEVVKLIVNTASSSATTPILDRIPTINPLNLSLSIKEIIKIVEAPNEVAKWIDKFLNLNVNLETADLEVSSALHFSQDFTLSVDDMSYLLTLEDNTTFAFAASEQGSIRIDEASNHDANGDGIVSYSLKIVPTAMFSNDTEFGLSYGYMLDFLQGKLKADLKLPLGELLPGLPPIVINMLDLEMGPLLRVQGDVDLWSVDIFEDRFDFDIGQAVVAGDFETATPISLIGISSSSDPGFIA